MCRGRKEDAEEEWMTNFGQSPKEEDLLEEMAIRQGLGGGRREAQGLRKKHKQTPECGQMGLG